MNKLKSLDFIGVLVGLLIGTFIGYLLANKVEIPEKDTPVMKEETLEYVYLLQVAKFDNPVGASNYQKVLSDKNLENIVIYDKVYYYIYGGISSTEEGLETIKSKYYILGYETIIKKELLIEKANRIIDDNRLYSFYCECIQNLYKSLCNTPFTISEKYYLDPINIELFTQLSILVNMKNDALRKTSQLQAYKIIVESL